MSLCLNEGCDVIVALMMADLDTSFPTSGEFCCSTRIQLFSPLSLSQITLCVIFFPQTSSKSFLSLVFSLLYPLFFCRRSVLPKTSSKSFLSFVFSLLYPLFFAGETDNLLRRSWTMGLGVGVHDSGGWMQEGGMLASACHVIQDTLLTKTHTMEQWVDFDIFVGNLSVCVSVSLCPPPPFFLSLSLSPSLSPFHFVSLSVSLSLLLSLSRGLYVKRLIALKNKMADTVIAS